MLESPVAFGGGPDPWENCPRVPGLFVPSQPGLRPPKRRTERPSQVGGGSPRKKMAIFFSQFLNHQAGWLAKRMFHRKRVYFFRQFQCFFFESTWTTVLFSFVIAKGRDTADFQKPGF